jgi:predicted Zn finger-like uncharacterized protein
LFTVCPKCTLTLVVTTVDLRAGQGYVRCGRCANVFNALIALREGEPGTNAADSANRRLQETAPKPDVKPALGSGVDIEPEPEPELEPEPVPEPEPEPEPFLAAGPDVSPEFELGDDPLTIAEEPSLEFDAISTDVSQIFIGPPAEDRDIGSGNYEAVVLEEEPASEFETPIETEEPSHTDTI